MIELENSNSAFDLARHAEQGAQPVPCAKLKFPTSPQCSDRIRRRFVPLYRISLRLFDCAIGKYYRHVYILSTYIRTPVLD